MSDKEHRWSVNTGSPSGQKSPQDRVNLILGTWVREEGGTWVFESETVEGSPKIVLSEDMKFRDLIQEVRSNLHITAENISLKLAYQYPQWMTIDDGDGTTPQYITDDNEVKFFILVRRHIEEVNLCVTMTEHINGVPTKATTNNNVVKPTETEEMQSSETNDSGENNEDEWHQFAMSDTPMTYPAFGSTQLSDLPPKMRSRIRTRSQGISINEGGSIIRLSNQIVPDLDKGKGIAFDNGSDSESEDEGDAVVPSVPMQVQAVSGNHHGNVGVRRRLFAEGENSQHTDCNRDDSYYEDDISEDEAEEGRRFSRWGRFEEALHQILSDFSADPTLFDRDAPPVFTTADGDELESALADVPYEGDKLFVGRVFKSKNDCKIKIAIHAINRRFHFRTTRSSPNFMVMKCVSPTCRWRIYAVLIDNTGNFQIRQATFKHTCTTDARRNYHRLATTQVIGELMHSKFVGIKRGPTPAGIRKILLDDFHVNVSYWKAWRAREIAMENAHGSMAGSYALIPAYLSLLQNANPGTICCLETVTNPLGGTRFKYCFVAYGASVAGFQYMRKVIVVDGTSMKGRYGGVLLSACAQDANFQIFPLAFAVVDSENDSSWEWFFEKLNSFVPDSTDLVFVSDRHSSIYSGLEKVFPLSHHAACVVHLWRNIRSDYKPRRVANIVSAAARAFTFEEFNKKFIEIQRLSPGCAAYLVDIGFDHWTRVHFKGKRYNIMDSNIAESWNAVLKEAREYPLICMLEYIRTAVMSWFAIRRAKATSNEQTLTPHVRQLVEQNFGDSTGLAVRAISQFEFQVQAQDGECFTVKLVDGTCSCMEFQQLGIPCSHAIAAAGSIKLPTDAMVSPTFYGNTWKNGFDEKIYPVPSVGSLELGGGFTGELLPPDVKRPPGRPKKIRIRSRGEFKRCGRKTGRRCTRCRRQGHNRASCRYAI